MAERRVAYRGVAERFLNVAQIGADRRRKRSLQGF
jgi:hypothetical protein